MNMLKKTYFGPKIDIFVQNKKSAQKTNVSSWNFHAKSRVRIFGSSTIFISPTNFTSTKTLLRPKLYFDPNFTSTRRTRRTTRVEVEKWK